MQRELKRDRTFESRDAKGFFFSLLEGCQISDAELKIENFSAFHEDCWVDVLTI